MNIFNCHPIFFAYIILNSAGQGETDKDEALATSKSRLAVNRPAVKM
jgi:hypothetical protein